MTKNREVIGALNEALRVEHTLAMQCHQYALTVSGLWRLSLAPFFRDLAGEARDHAAKFGAKVVALGGTPATQLEDVRDSEDAFAMVEDILALERRAMSVYLSALAVVPEGDVALRTMIEDHIADEQLHIDEIEQLVRGGAPGHQRAVTTDGVRRAS
ncbi:MAG: ferritin-like domain-containing protein [Myxococcota bacterium]